MGKKSDRNGELNYGVVADRKVGIMHVYRYGNMEADIVLIQLGDILFQGCFHYGLPVRQICSPGLRQHRRLSGFRDL